MEQQEFLEPFKDDDLHDDDDKTVDAEVFHNVPLRNHKVQPSVCELQTVPVRSGSAH